MQQFPNIANKIERLQYYFIVFDCNNEIEMLKNEGSIKTIYA